MKRASKNINLFLPFVLVGGFLFLFFQREARLEEGVIELIVRGDDMGMTDRKSVV